MNKFSGNTPVLNLENISHSYFQQNNEIRILKNINLKVSHGEIIALTGPSGTGKSTLLNIAGILEKPLIGSVNINGTNCGLIDEEKRTYIRGKNIGFIFQSHRLFPEFSALENVMLPQLLMGITSKYLRFRGAGIF